MEYDVKSILFLQWFGEPVSKGLVVLLRQFLLKRPEHFVPNNEKNTQIFIQIEGVGGMMHPVVGGCYQKIFQPAQFVDMFCMDQNAPNLTGCKYKNDICRLEAHTNHQPEPIPERCGEFIQPVFPKPLKYNQINQAEYQVNTTIQQHQVQVGKGVLNRIGFGVPVMAQEHFSHNDCDVKRGAQQY